MDPKISEYLEKIIHNEPVRSSGMCLCPVMCLKHHLENKIDYMALLMKSEMVSVIETLSRWKDSQPYSPDFFINQDGTIFFRNTNDTK